MGKWTDKAYITAREWQSDFGGAKAASSSPFSTVRFEYTAALINTCHVTFTEISEEDGAAVCAPYCTNKSDMNACWKPATVFSYKAIVEHLRRVGPINPYTKDSLREDQLLPIRFCRTTTTNDEKSTVICPVTRKAFTPCTKVLASKRSGWVYSAEGLERLAFRDLEDDAVLAPSDLIVLRDPALNPNKLPLANDKILPASSHSAAIESDVNLGGFVHSAGKVAASLTSSAMQPVLRQEARQEQPYLHRMLSAVSANSSLPEALATIRTNMGDLHVELWSSKSPWCTYNFVQLAKQGYWVGSPMDRLVPGLGIQGGASTTSHSGDRSCYAGSPGFDSHGSFYEPSHVVTGMSPPSHDKRGILSMASYTNIQPTELLPATHVCRTQFFVTFAACPHLDFTHPAFGRILTEESHKTLTAIESIGLEHRNEADEGEGETQYRPARPIYIEDVIVVEDPFVPFEAEFKKKEIINAKKVAHLKPAEYLKGPSSTKPLIGKYLPKTVQKK